MTASKGIYKRTPKHPDPTMRYCIDCGAEFPKRNPNTRTTCPECSRKRNQKCWEENKDTYNERRRENEAEKKQRWQDMRKARTYNLTLEQVQEYKHLPCEVCGKPASENRDGVTVFDHNHETGEFRGMLCNDCNRSLGMMKDSPELLRKLANYVETR